MVFTGEPTSPKAKTSAEEGNLDPLPEETSQTFPSFRAIAYEDTLMTNQPRRVTPTDQESPLTTTTREVRFPARFNLYILNYLHGRYYLGQHRADPLYRVSISRPNVVLYNGLEKQDPLIGTLVHRSTLRRRRPRDQIYLPSGKINIENDGKFTMDVPSPDGIGTRKETFEWRATRGPAVRLLGKHSGLKLVRLATDVSRGSGHVETGGGEAVAVLAFYGVRWRKAAAFQFQGSGAQGILGQDWEVAAVMTAIGLWERHERS
ncbi:hypothetical protein VMCG_08845 [Cytospora schulzeri]|uniref:Uncharacterized protein n=1 Tax=Cytospora schulzeri TaxID=448051 RepID=A0A423VUQ0_9PEZI|nr:hypothetical protein VMCG_08845 [Valsa malicola]